MGWGEPKGRGVGTTGQVEDAHAALDALGVEQVEEGPLALRAIAAGGMLDRLAAAERRERLVIEALEELGARLIECTDCGRRVVLPPTRYGRVLIVPVDGWTAPPPRCPECSASSEPQPQVERSGSR